MKLKNLLNRKTIIIMGIIILGLITALIYQSYALFKTNKKMNFINATVGEFSTADIKLAVYLDGEKTSKFPSLEEGQYEFDKMICTDTGVAKWDSVKWELAVLEIKGPTNCNVYFITIRSFIEVLLENNDIKTGTPDFTRGYYNPEDEGLWEINGYDGPTSGTGYYFRGSKALNNNVIFAGFQWKIIRIDKNGNIRMIYNGECSNNNCEINDTGTNTQIGTSFIKNNSFGALPSYSDSAIKNQNVSWYNNNLLAYDSYIVDVGYCNRLEGSGYGNLYYSYYNNTQLSPTKPTLACPKGYYITVSNTEGTAGLGRKIGLITADEVNFAGQSYSYLKTGEIYWTMSPAEQSWQNEYDFHGSSVNITGGGGISSTSVSNVYGVRPVIALKADIEIRGGNGSEESPYIVSTPIVP